MSYTVCIGFPLILTQKIYLPVSQAGSLFDRVKREPETKPPADSVAAIRLGTSPLPISPKPTGMFKPKTEESHIKLNPFSSPPRGTSPTEINSSFKTETSSSNFDVSSRGIDVKPSPMTPQPSKPNGAAQRYVLVIKGRRGGIAYI